MLFGSVRLIVQFAIWTLTFRQVIHRNALECKRHLAWMAYDNGARQIECQQWLSCNVNIYSLLDTFRYSKMISPNILTLKPYKHHVNMMQFIARRCFARHTFTVIAIYECCCWKCILNAVYTVFVSVLNIMMLPLRRGGYKTSKMPTKEEATYCIATTWSMKMEITKA